MFRPVVIAIALVLAFVLLAVACDVSAPWIPPRILHGKVVRAELAPGARGAVGLVFVELDDGSVVSYRTDGALLPAKTSMVAVEERFGVLGQRLISPH